MPIERKRGRFLTVWLILLPIANTVISLWCWIVLFILGMQSAVFGYDWGGIVTLAIIPIVPILNIVFSVAVWKWKRWGVFGLGVMSIAASFVSGWSVLFFYLAPVGLVGIIVLAILVRPIWKHFE